LQTPIASNHLQSQLPHFINQAIKLKFRYIKLKFRYIEAAHSLHQNISKRSLHQRLRRSDQRRLRCRVACGAQRFVKKRGRDNACVV